MKIAICFFGLTYGVQAFKRSTKSVDCLLGWKTILKHIYKDHQCDTFFHAWVDTNERTQFLKDVLEPNACKTEKLRPFHSDWCHHDANITGNVSKKKVRKQRGSKFRWSAILSQLYSRGESIKLALESMKSKGDEYDFIIALRYDIYFNRDMCYEALRNDVLYYSEISKS